jgi:tryptophan synthase beta chain
MKRKIFNGSGNYGDFGGCFAPELLQPILKKVEKTFNDFKESKKLKKEFSNLLKNYAGRETPVYFAKNLSEKIGGAQI